MLRNLKRKFSISAPRLSVRPHVPWYVRWAVTVPFILAAGWMVWWAYDSGLELAGFHRGLAEKELDGLRDHVIFLESENIKLANQLAVDQQQIEIDKSVMQETANQLKNLTGENSQLKEDLSFFQNLPLTEGKESGLTIQRLKVEPDALPGEYHCRMLLVQNVQQRGKEFQGHMQFLVTGMQAGKKVVLQFPALNSPDSAAYQLNFKYYQRVDHAFNVTQEMQIESIQIRVFEKGVTEPKVKQTIKIS